MEQERIDYWRGQLLVYEAAVAYGQTEYQVSIDSIKDALAEPEVKESKEPEAKVPETKEPEDKPVLSQHERNLATLAELRGKQSRVYSSERVERPEQPVQLSDYQKKLEANKQTMKDIRSGRVEENND